MTNSCGFEVPACPPDWQVWAGTAPGSEIEHLGTLALPEAETGRHRSGKSRWYVTARIRAAYNLTTGSLFDRLRQGMHAWVTWNSVYLRIIETHASPTGVITLTCTQGGLYGLALIDGRPYPLLVVEPSPPAAASLWLPAERVRVLRETLGESTRDRLIAVPAGVPYAAGWQICDPWAAEFDTAPTCGEPAEDSDS